MKALTIRHCRLRSRSLQSPAGTSQYGDDQRRRRYEEVLCLRRWACWGFPPEIKRDAYKEILDLENAGISY